MKRSERSAWLTSLALLVSSLALRADEPAVVKDGRVNVRAQPSLVGEVITQLQQGEKVVILEEVPGAKGKTNEPPRWARIQMPANTPVWVYAPFVDTNSKSVKVSRLNLRAGPGENYGVVGRLKKGDALTEIRRTGDWIEIATPPGAYAFVAADLLTKEQAGAAPGQSSTALTSPATKIEPKPAPLITQAPPPLTTQTPPASTTQSTPPARPFSTQPPPPLVTQNPAPPMTQTPPPPVYTAPSPAPAAAANTNLFASAKTEKPALPPAQTQVPPVHSTQPIVTTPVPAPGAHGAATTVVRSTNFMASAAPGMPAARPQTAPSKSDEGKADEGLQRRIVRREGLVRSTGSIQAPTYYELLNPDNRKTINYLHTDALGLDMKDYRGRRIVVTGEELIDPRWPKTPVIEVEKLQLIP